jgi:hypothetical protein
MVQPVKWDENQKPGIIDTLIARDYDSEQNGPPFEFKIADSATYDITTKFSITGKVHCYWKVQDSRDLCCSEV